MNGKKFEAVVHIVDRFDPIHLNGVSESWWLDRTIIEKDDCECTFGLVMLGVNDPTETYNILAVFPHEVVLFRLLIDGRLVSIANAEPVLEANYMVVSDLIMLQTGL